MNDVEYQSLIDRDVAHMLHPQYLSGAKICDKHQLIYLGPDILGR
jgi:hypothetical protein